MTIIYQNRVATTSLGGFLKLLRAWKGSVYKLLYKELIIFVSLYAFISLIYRLALTEDQKRIFESIVIELKQASSLIPLSFLLGFYVTFIVQRWWQQFINVPWPDRWWWTPFITLLLPDRTLFVMATYLHGFDEKSRMMRRSVARYVLFGLILICRAVSVSVMKRFPTIDHIVEAGFITKEEAEMYEKVQCRYLKFWVPMMWANQVLVTARREGRIQTDYGLRMVIECLADFRDKCSVCFVYDWITVPLVYTQVVTFATYSYFAVALLGQQYLDPKQKYAGYTSSGDFYFPGFTILQFLFYMGWLKVAEQMINPFGEDDDDYDINWLLDRHTAVAFCLTDQCYGRHPVFTKDQFWDDLVADVPYTESSLGSIRPNFMGTTFDMEKPTIEAEKMIMTDHEDISNTPWHQRSKGKNSVTGSLLSLFHTRSSRRSPSQVTLESTGSMHGRAHNAANGKATKYSTLSHEQEEMRKSSVDLPVKEETDNSIKAAFQVRQRANTDSDCIDEKTKNRKLSLPIQDSPASTSKPSSSPKSSRFTIEPVKDSDSEPESSNKARRIGHVNAPFLSVDKVSRIPELSAIEEGNTITSMSQFMPGYSAAQLDQDHRFMDIVGEFKNRDDPNNNSRRESRNSYTAPNSFSEPLIQDLDEDYITAEAASDPNSPVYPYFDAIDTADIEDSLLGRRRNAPQGRTSKRH